MEHFALRHLDSLEVSVLSSWLSPTAMESGQGPYLPKTNYYDYFKERCTDSSQGATKGWEAELNYVVHHCPRHVHRPAALSEEKFTVRIIPVVGFRSWKIQAKS